MTSIKGERALALARLVASQLRDLLPPDVEHVACSLSGRGIVHVEARLSRPTSPPPAAPGETYLGSLGTKDTIVFGGFGTWLPWLPQALAAKVVAEDVLSTLVNEVSVRTDHEWLPTSGIKARCAGDHVVLSLLWKGRRRELEPIPIAMCLP